MAKCYTIEKGEYSDYRIVGIYTTKEKAEIALKFFNGNEYSEYSSPKIIERELDPDLIDINAGLIPFEVLFYHNPKNEAKSVISQEVDDYPSLLQEQHNDYQDNYIVWAKDKDHAFKIAVDKNTQYHAMMQGIS